MAEGGAAGQDPGTVMLVDGNSLVYRAFFAVPEDMTTASGQVTNAVYGFTRMLLTLLRDHGPDRVGVAFDRREPTFRHERESSYKANRRRLPKLCVSRWALSASWWTRWGSPRWTTWEWRPTM